MAADNAWTPLTGQLSTRTNVTNTQRTATHFIKWDQNGTDLFGTNDEFTFLIELALNDSDNSTLGPGIFLDVPSAIVESSLPNVEIYAKGGWGITQRFSAIVLQPSTIISGTTYFIRWRSDPGTATQDNGDLILQRARQLCDSTWCTFIATYCRVNQDLYAVQPIPGIYEYLRPPQNRCTNALPYWLPLILR